MTLFWVLLVAVDDTQAQTKNTLELETIQVNTLEPNASVILNDNAKTGSALSINQDALKLLKKGRRKLIPGSILTGVGASLLFLSIPLLASSNNENFLSGIVGVTYGLTLAAPGLILTGVGIPLTVIGAKQKREAKMILGTGLSYLPQNVQRSLPMYPNHNYVGIGISVPIN